MTGTQKAATTTSADGFTAEERAAMKERAKELRATTDGEAAVHEKLAEMSAADRALAEAVHSIVRAEAPHLVPRTWYGQPAYALPGKGSKPGPIVCFFQPAEKFGSRYATLGFNDDARLDDGTMWPTSFALTEMNAANEQEIARLVRTAAG
ncbi:DUF1801 domain-containing protein [Cellulosimicrobium sp. Marseille-Q4280]|jgi:uncharacterized protein YdhG (YjbR/CyaY superfamily)|uniref:iron chaperone n=1 Tax=Cellulosimicrobium sp. Marseille-Q4280 TaxID=2937992 RepID=UPI00204069CF|nr:DUF1801 domain-containing protein [Cellulosimicrobium sp. Marseille-Q4280]